MSNATVAPVTPPRMESPTAKLAAADAAAIATSPLVRYWRAKSPDSEAKSPRFHFRPVTMAEMNGLA